MGGGSTSAVMAELVPAIHVSAAGRSWMPATSAGMTANGDDERRERCVRALYPSPSSLASTPFTALAQPFSLRSRVALLIAGLKRCSRRQLSANFDGSG
jgi:hypothetical protein